MFFKKVKKNRLTRSKYRTRVKHTRRYQRHRRHYIKGFVGGNPSDPPPVAANNNPKVAILFSGRIKGYENVKDNLESIKKAYNPIVFCCLNKRFHSYYIKKFCEFMDITSDRLKLIISPRVPHILLNNPKVRADPHWIQGVRHGEYEGKEGRYSGAYSHMFQMKSVYDLMDEYQKRNNMVFDIVLSYRADIDTKEKLQLAYPVKDMTLYVPAPKGDSSDPNTWCDHGGLCNQVFYGNPATMKIACYLLDNVEELAINQNVTYHCESLLKRHMENNKVNIERFPYFFSLHISRHEKNLMANIP